MFALLFGQHIKVHAATSAPTQTFFTIMPKYPSNQDVKVTGYYKLNFKDKKQQQLSIDVRNDKDGPITILMGPLNALTNSNGGIDYTDVTANNSSNLTDPLFALKPLITMPDKLTLKKGETKTITVSIKAPKISSGTAVGGIHFIEEGAGTQGQSSTSGGVSISVFNKVDVKMGIVLEFEKGVASDMTLSDSLFQAFTSGPVVYLPLINNAARIEQDISGEITVYDSKGVVSFSSSFKDVTMAPKSTMKYPFTWGGATITDGTYRVVSSLSLKGEKLATNENTFEVKQSDIEYLPQPSSVNPIAVFDQVKNNIWIYFILGGTFVIAFAIGIWVTRKKRKPDTNANGNNEGI
jgi:hypothetical protein